GLWPTGAAGGYSGQTTRAVAAGNPALARELDHEAIYLAPVAISQHGVHAAPRGVEMDGGEAQAPLERAFHPADALDLGQGEEVSDVAEPPAGDDDVPPVGGPRELPVAQRRLPAGPAWR